MWVRRIFQYHVVQRQVGDDLLQPDVLPLQLLETAGLVEVQAAVLLAPAVVRLLADAELLGNLADRAAFGQLDLGLAQLVNDRPTRPPFRSPSPSWTPTAPSPSASRRRRFLAGLCSTSSATGPAEPSRRPL